MKTYRGQNLEKLNYFVSKIESYSVLLDTRTGRHLNLFNHNSLNSTTYRLTSPTFGRYNSFCMRFNCLANPSTEADLQVRLRYVDTSKSTSIPIWNREMSTLHHDWSVVQVPVTNVTGTFQVIIDLNSTTHNDDPTTHNDNPLMQIDDITLRPYDSACTGRYCNNQVDKCHAILQII